jgi:hypothetical protein
VRRSRRVLWIPFLCALALTARAAPARQPADAPRQQHAWGRFAPGAWKTIRVVTETLDSGGAVASRSMTESTTTLTQADDKSFTLRIESVMEVAGKRIIADPQTLSQRYNGTSPNQTPERRTLPDERLLIDGQEYVCQVEEVTVLGPMSRTVTRTWHAPRIAPFVLKRDSTTTNPNDGALIGRSTQEVVALDMPHKLLDKSLSAAHVKVTQTHDKGTTVTMAITTFDVPGGVVAHTTKELDPTGRVVRRGTLELIDYGLESSPPDELPLRRPRRMRRHRIREGLAPPATGRTLGGQPAAAERVTPREG